MRISNTDVASVTILADTTMQADAISTAVFILGPDKGFAFLERTLFAHDPAAHDVSMAWRRKIQYTLHQKAYDVLPLNVVDVRVGTRQPSDTLSLSTEDVQQLLGVDGLLYSTITA